jgi:hypothetical protein
MMATLPHTEVKLFNRWTFDDLKKYYGNLWCRKICVKQKYFSLPLGLLELLDFLQLKGLNNPYLASLWKKIKVFLCIMEGLLYMSRKEEHQRVVTYELLLKLKQLQEPFSRRMENTLVVILAPQYSPGVLGLGLSS